MDKLYRELNVLLRGGAEKSILDGIECYSVAHIDPYPNLSVDCWGGRSVFLDHKKATDIKFDSVIEYCGPLLGLTNGVVRIYGDVLIVSAYSEDGKIWKVEFVGTKAPYRINSRGKKISLKIR